ncbi:MAG: shikimate kinase [Dokdonella sp.]
MNPAANLILIGPMGAGKTSVGRRLANLMELPFVDVDEAIEARTGASIALTFDIEGEAGFRKRESDMLIDILGDSGQVVSTGGGAVLDDANRQLLRARGFVVWLDAGVETQLLRLRHDRKRPLLQTDNPHQQLQQLAALRNPLYQALADLHVSSNEARSSALLAKQLARMIADRWQRSEVIHSA